jgi:hypothetical protein
MRFLILNDILFIAMRIKFNGFFVMLILGLYPGDCWEIDGGFFR